MNTEQLHYRNILDHLPQMVCQFDLDLRLTFTNTAYQKWRGQTEMALRGSHVFHNLSAEQKARAQQHIANLSLENRTAVSVQSDTSPAGAMHWVEWQDGLIVNDQGDITGYQRVGRDVTQEKQVVKQLEQTKEALRSSQDKYRTISELMSDSAIEYRLDNGGSLQHLWEWGSNINERLGYSPQDLKKITLPLGVSIIHHEDRAKVERAIHETLHEGKETSNEYRLKTKDGRYLWFLARRKPTWDEEGNQVRGFVLALKEITQRKEAESDLRDNEERYRTISELVSDYASEVILDDKGRPIRSMWLGSNINEVLGYTQEDGLPSELNLGLSYYHPDDQLHLQSSIQQTLAGKETTGEYRIIAKNGTYHWFSSRRKPTWDETGTIVTGYLIALKNITAEKNAEITLRESEERYRLISGLMSDSAHYFELDNDGVPQRLWTLGVQTEQVLGRPPTSINDAAAIHEIIHPDDVAQVQEGIDRTIEGYETIDNYRLRHANGSYLWFTVHRRPIWDSDNQKVVAYIVAMKDITLTKQAEEALREANHVLEERVATRTASLEKIKNQLEAIFNNSGDSILHLDQTFHMIEANEACDKLFRKKRDTYLGSQFTGYISTKDIITFQKAAMNVSKTHKVQQIELAFMRGKTPINIEASVSHIFGSQKESNGYILNIRDISARKQTEQALRTALETEQDVSELKTRIISVASHEFRTPLTAILATTETLIRFRSRIDDEKINNRLATIVAQVHHLRNITEDMLQLTRLQTNTHTLDVAPQNLDVLCLEVIETLHTQEKYTQRIDYICMAEHKVASIDKHLLSQAISNLVQNALKYSDIHQKVLVTVYSDQHSFRLMVQDQGIGIPQTDIKRLFDPFHRASNVGVISGTGLGLSIAKRAVEAHNGTISVDSELGRGTTFTIVIPTSG